MSKDTENVSWKLNELIHASRRAAYRRYESLEHTEKGQEFVPWSPTLVKLLDDQITENEEESTQEDSTLSEEAVTADAPEETLVPEEEMIAKVRESYEKGFDEGKAKTEADYAQKSLEIDNLIDGFKNAQSDLDEFHSPLVKLSLALAKHLTRAELNLNSAAVGELVSKSLSEIESSREGAIVVFLSEDDLDGAENILGERFPDVRFEVDEDLSSGSLRVVMDDTSIDDLIENRLESLAHQVFGMSERNSQKNQTIAVGDESNVNAEPAEAGDVERENVSLESKSLAEEESMNEPDDSIDGESDSSVADEDYASGAVDEIDTDQGLTALDSGESEDKV